MMEKVKTVKKQNILAQNLSSRKTKYIVGTVLLSGIGIALPRIFHVLGGASSGATFLPMHIAVLIAALVFGALSSSVVAVSSVIASFLLTQMPNLARLPYMLIELIIYAVMLSVLNKKFNSYVSFLVTIVLGRILYGAVLFLVVDILSLPSYGISLIESVKIGLPGIALQLICVPFIAKQIKKGIQLDD